MRKLRVLALATPVAFSALLLAPTTSAAVARDATHEVVCSCSCGDDTQTFEYNLGDDCSDYDGITCTDSNNTERELSGCVAKAQPKNVSVSPSLTPEPPMRSGFDQPLFGLP